MAENEERHRRSGVLEVDGEASAASAAAAMAAQGTKQTPRFLHSEEVSTVSNESAKAPAPNTPRSNG